MDMDSPAQKFVWYIEAWSDPASDKGPISQASGVVVHLEKLVCEAGTEEWIRAEQPEHKKYLLTCAHAVRTPVAGYTSKHNAGNHWGVRYKQILCWQPEETYSVKNAEQRTEHKYKADPCGRTDISPAWRNLGEVPEEFRRELHDWILLDIEDPDFQNEPSIPWAMSCDSPFVIIGYPGGPTMLQHPRKVRSKVSRGFSLYTDSESQTHPKMLVLWGNGDTAKGMSGGAVCNHDGQLAGLHLANFRDNLEWHSVSAEHIKDWLRINLHYALVPPKPQPVRIAQKSISLVFYAKNSDKKDKKIKYYVEAKLFLDNWPEAVWKKEQTLDKTQAQRPFGIEPEGLTLNLKECIEAAVQHNNEAVKNGLTAVPIRIILIRDDNITWNPSRWDYLPALVKKPKILGQYFPVTLRSRETLMPEYQDFISFRQTKWDQANGEIFDTVDCHEEKDPEIADSVVGFAGKSAPPDMAIFRTNGIPAMVWNPKDDSKCHMDHHTLFRKCKEIQTWATVLKKKRASSPCCLDLHLLHEDPHDDAMLIEAFPIFKAPELKKT